MIIAAMVIWMYILDLIQGEKIAPSIKAWVTRIRFILQELKSRVKKYKHKHFIIY